MHGTIYIQMSNGTGCSIGGTIIGPRHIISAADRETIDVTTLKSGKIEGSITYYQPSPISSVIQVKDAFIVESTGGGITGVIMVFLLEKTLPKTVLYQALLDTDLTASTPLPEKAAISGWNGGHKIEDSVVIDKMGSNELRLSYTVTSGSLLMGSAIWTSAHEKIKVIGFHYQNGTGTPVTADKQRKIDEWMRTTDIDKSTGQEISEPEASGKMSKAEIRGITIDKCDLDKWPWNTHGLLRLKSDNKSSFGSASIIGPRHIVTAQHNLAHSVGANTPEAYKIKLERYLKRSGEPVESYWPCFTGESLGKAGNPEDIEPYKPLHTIFKENRLGDAWKGGSIGDIALLTLQDNLEESVIKDFLTGDFIVEPLKWDDLPEGTPVFAAGYPANKNGRMWFAKGMVLLVSGDDFVFSADTVGTGFSGSAVWTYEGVRNGKKRRRLVGINSGGGSAEPGCARASLITADIYSELMKWLNFEKKVSDYTRELNSENIGNKLNAAVKLGGMDSLAAAAIPGLLDSLGHPDDRLKEEVARALGKICANIDYIEKPLVRNKLAATIEAIGLNEKTKFAAAKALVSVDPFEAGRYFESIDRLAVFVRVVEDTSLDVALRVSALKALGMVGGQYQEIESNRDIIFYLCQKLCQVLGDNADVVKKAALEGLERMKVKACTSVDRLVTLLGVDPGDTLNTDIMYALGAIIPPSLEQGKISVLLAKDALNKVIELKTSLIDSIKETAREIYPILKLAVINAEK